MNSMFRGGIHPPDNKNATAGLGIERMPVPARLVVSMAQHLGVPAKPLVAKGDKVMRMQPIAEPGGFISAAVHAPASGTVKSVAEAPTVSGRRALAVEIEADGEDRVFEGITPMPDWEERRPEDLIGRVADAGVVGMGGAGFPTHVKLSPPPGKKIEILLVNGAECEPYLTADHRLMLEQPDMIALGIRVMRRILSPARVVVAIEDNKPDAAARMRAALQAAGDGAETALLPVRYPQGAEKQQIFAITGREVPSGKLPMDVGALVENVATVAAVARAVVRGEPLIERVMTVTGAGVARPANLMVRLGTRMADAIDFCGGLKGRPGKAISGGPMMGLAMGGLDVSVTKTCSGLLMLAAGQVRQFKSMPCIGCGRCVQACPMGLEPCFLSEMAEAEDHAGAEKLSAADCMECGCCAYECPAMRPLVQHIRTSKAVIADMRREREQKKKGN